MIRRASLSALPIFAALACLAAPGAATTPAPGTQLWVSAYDGTHGDGIAVALSAHGNGRVFVAGTSYPGPPLVDYVDGSNYASVAYNAATGDKLWTSQYDGPQHSTDTVSAVDVSPDGTKVFVTGTSNDNPAVTGCVRAPPGTPCGSAYATIAYDAATGARLWRARFEDDNNDRAWALVVSGDGARVFVTGEGAPGCSCPYDSVTIAYSAATGQRLWVSRYGDGQGVSALRSLAVSDDGSKVYATGWSAAPTTAGYDYVTVAYRAVDGNQLWAVTYASSGNDADRANAVASTGGKVFVTGNSASSPPIPGVVTTDIATVAYDGTSGQQLWVARLARNTGGSAGAGAIAVKAGCVFVTGARFRAATGYDYLTAAYDAATGKTLWTARHGTAGDDHGRGLATNDDGTRVYVTGTVAVGQSGASSATIAYDAGTGQQLWGNRYTLPGPAYANAISFGNGAVFVAAQAVRNATDGNDFVTLAYQP
jgi:PQQ-like domain